MKNNRPSVLDQTISFRYILYFFIPLLLTLLLGYTHLRSINRDLQSKRLGDDQKISAFEGEIYKLKQGLDQKDAKLQYVLNPDYKRYLLKSNENSGHIWLFSEPATSSWFAEMQEAPILPDGENFKLYIGGQKVGEFEKISDTVGLQKIGENPMGKIQVYGGVRKSDDNLKLLYELEPPI